MTPRSAVAFVAAGVLTCAASCGKSDGASRDDALRIGRNSVTPASRECLAAFGDPPEAERTGERRLAQFVAVDRAPTARHDLDDDGASLARPHLALQATREVKKNEPLLLNVTWENPTARTLSILHAVHDGSFRRREAQYALYAQSRASGKISRYVDHAPMFCGTLNKFQDADHHVVGPGGSFDAAPYTRTGHDVRGASLPEAGHYTMWLAYRFCGYSSTGETYDSVRGDVLTASVTSNSVEIDVVD